MTDQPGVDPEQRLPATRPPADVAPTDRFSAPPSVHSNELSPERAAGIVRQSASARFVGLIAVLVVVLFVIVYYFYELGVPGIPNTSRLAAETNAQQVTAVENGYGIFEANCARCHGAQGQGGIGPVLDDQSKLFVHLNEAYIRAVLFAGGRYVCGNAKSLMPVWDNANGGPLNYEQINDLIAFIRAPSTQTFTVRDYSTKEPVTDPVTGKVETFTGWRDPNYKPAPSATPFPDCWSSALTSSAAPSGPAASPTGQVVDETAQNIAFTQTSLSATAGQAFTIAFDNEDSAVPHNIEIKDASGASKFKGALLTGVAKTNYIVPALTAGSYTFVCDVHPNMTGTLTVK
jgi:mono/diheme cytochrome c family protein/plastocyanin